MGNKHSLTDRVDFSGQRSDVWHLCATCTEDFSIVSTVHMLLVWIHVLECRASILRMLRFTTHLLILLGNDVNWHKTMYYTVSGYKHWHNSLSKLTAPNSSAFWKWKWGDFWLVRILSTSGLFEAKDFSLRFGLEISNLFVMFRVKGSREFIMFVKVLPEKEGVWGRERKMQRVIGGG